MSCWLRAKGGMKGLRLRDGTTEDDPMIFLDPKVPQYFTKRESSDFDHDGQVEAVADPKAIAIGMANEAALCNSDPDRFARVGEELGLKAPSSAPAPKKAAKAPADPPPAEA